jgi:hypothetical protein
MADKDCCNSFGGLVTVDINGERWPPTDADIVLDVSNVAVTGGANHDGSAFYTSKPKLFGAEISFRKPCGVRFNDAMRKCKVNVTIVEVDHNRTHLFTGARIVGEPKLNLTTGELTGLTVNGPRYQEI